MAQRHRSRAAYSARSDDVEEQPLPESTRVLSPHSHKPRPREITPAGDNGGGNGSAEALLHAGQLNSPPRGDEMGGGGAWHGSVKRIARPSSNWFNTVMGTLLLVMTVFGYARLPLPGSVAVRHALLATASRSPFACSGGTPYAAGPDGAALRDPRSLSGLLNAEEPPQLMITMPADPEKKALAEKMVADEKARWKAEWQESQRLKKAAKAKADADRRQSQEDERKRKQRQAEDAAQRKDKKKDSRQQVDARDSRGSERSSKTLDTAADKP